MNVVYNCDCLPAVREYPDGYFDLCVADPPYGINVTTRHLKKDRDPKEETESHTLTTVHTHTHTHKRRSSEAEADHSAVKMAKLYGAAKSNLASQNFIPCSTTAPRRTQRYSGSYRG